MIIIILMILCAFFSGYLYYKEKMFKYLKKIIKNDLIFSIKIKKEIYLLRLIKESHKCNLCLDWPVKCENCARLKEIQNKEK